MNPEFYPISYWLDDVYYPTEDSFTFLSCELANENNR